MHVLQGHALEGVLVTRNAVFPIVLDIAVAVLQAVVNNVTTDVEAVALVEEQVRDVGAPRQRRSG